MGRLVGPDIAPLGESFVADITGVRFLTRVAAFMSLVERIQSGQAL